MAKIILMLKKMCSRKKKTVTWYTFYTLYLSRMHQNPLQAPFPRAQSPTKTTASCLFFILDSALRLLIADRPTLACSVGMVLSTFWNFSQVLTKKETTAFAACCSLLSQQITFPSLWMPQDRKTSSMACQLKRDCWENNSNTLCQDKSAYQHSLSGALRLSGATGSCQLVHSLSGILFFFGKSSLCRGFLLPVVCWSNRHHRSAKHCTSFPTHLKSDFWPSLSCVGERQWTAALLFLLD